MTGNTFGRVFRVTTWGESHGKAVGCVVDGCPAGMELDVSDIQKELDRRKPGKRLTSPRKESDIVEILSGVFEGYTLGTPISMLVYNKDVDSKPYERIKNLFRPGHADYTYYAKFGIRDWRGGGRSSARETVGRVAGGAIAKKILSKFGIEIIGYTIEIAGIRANLSEMDIEERKKRAEKSEISCPDYEVEREMIREIENAKREGDSVGGIIEIVVTNVPPGVGEPVFMKLDAYLSYALMSIPAVKGVEIGAGFSSARMKGSEMNDQMSIVNGRVVFLSNNSGGVLGGISNGNDIIVRIAIKPTSSIAKQQKTVNIERFTEEEIVVKGRHDPCIVPRAIPVAEAMTAIAIVDLMMLQGLIPRFFR